MTESRLIVVLLAALGLASALMAVYADEEKNTDTSHGSHQESGESHVHKEVKKGEKKESRKGGTTSSAAATQQPGGHDAAHEEDEEEGSH
jgi:hypothetical protein